MAAENILKNKQETAFEDAMQAMQQKSFNEKKIKYKMLNMTAKRGQIVFVGSSLMEFFPIDEMQLLFLHEKIIYNRGIAGATTAELLDAMDACVLDLEPSKIFINIGSNDIGLINPNGNKYEKLLANYNEIMDIIKTRVPACEVYVMAYYPVNSKADFKLDKKQKEALFITRTNENIAEANEAVAELAKKHGFCFIDVNEGLTDEEGYLKKELTIEGVHLWPNAYAIIIENMKKYLV